MGELVKPSNCKFDFYEDASSNLAPFSFIFTMQNYFSVFIFFLLSVLLSSIIFFLSFICSTKLDDAEKLSAYECGFNPFSDSRNEFDIKFYLIAILFIIFDLEISFLFPFSVCLDILEFNGFFAMLFFLWLLTVGFIFEWKKGALDWD